MPARAGRLQIDEPELNSKTISLELDLPPKWKD